MLSVAVAQSSSGWLATLCCRFVFTQVCVEPRPSAVNMTLLLPERGRLQLSIDTLSSKPAPRRCCCQSMILTVGLTDTRPFHRPCCKYSAGNADNVQYTCMCVEFFNTFHQRSPWQSLVSTVTLFSLFLASESLYKGCSVPFVWNKLEIDDLMQGKQG